MTGRVVALTGGVGGAKLVHGLSLVMPPEDLTVIVNTGDDFTHLGLTICPDIDSVVYALAGISDSERGWGRKNETWTFMETMKTLGGDTWFAVGDGDLAMHVERSKRLREGQPLSTVTADLCRALGIKVHVVPMSDEAVRTRLRTSDGWLEFQDYFVRHACAPAVREIVFEGAPAARMQRRASVALSGMDLRAIVICPSNPFVSVEPILSVPGMRSAIVDSSAPVVAVTPIPGGVAVKGPAAKMMRELGLEVSATTLLERYRGLIDVFIADESDPPVAGSGGLAVIRAKTLMRSVDDRVSLARTVLGAADAARRRY